MVGKMGFSQYPATILQFLMSFVTEVRSNPKFLCVKKGGMHFFAGRN